MKNMPLTTRCRACKAEIMFIQTALYKKIPVNAEPVWIRPDENAKGTYVLPTGDTIRGEIVPDTFDDEKAGLRLAYVSHFATCTTPEQFRKPRERRRAERDG